ncbi:protein of unknown function [Nitratireductor aquimarinus]
MPRLRQKPCGVDCNNHKLDYKTQV